jgi:hypothetical protein
VNGVARSELLRLEVEFKVRQVLLDLAWPCDVPEAGVGSSSTPLRDIEWSVH